MGFVDSGRISAAVREGIALVVAANSDQSAQLLSYLNGLTAGGWTDAEVMAVEVQVTRFLLLGADGRQQPGDT